MSGLALRRNAFWSILGSCAQQVSNLLLLIAISRMLGGESLGKFSYAIAICSPIIALSTLGLRNLQVVESSERFSHYDFRRVQLIASLVAIVAINLTGWIIGKRNEALIAILLVSVSQAVTSQLDTVLACFQKLRRMDIVAQCRTFTAIGVLPVCISVAVLTRSLTSVLSSLVVVRLVSFFVYSGSWLKSLDPTSAGRPASWKRSRELAFSSTHIAAMTGVATLEVAIPSLALDYFQGATVLGHYMVICTIYLPIPFVINSILQASLPYLGSNLRESDSIVSRVITYLFALTLLGIAFVFVAGTPVLKLFLGDSYVPVEKQLALVFVVSFFSVTATVLMHSLIARQMYRLCFIYSTASCSATALIAILLVPAYGLSGAVLAPLVGKIVAIALSLIVRGKLKQFSQDGHAYSNAQQA